MKKNEQAVSIEKQNFILIWLTILTLDAEMNIYLEIPSNRHDCCKSIESEEQKILVLKVVEVRDEKVANVSEE